MQGDSQLVRAVRVRCLAQGQLNTQLGRAGNRTGNLPVFSQPALPPKPYAAMYCFLIFLFTSSLFFLPPICLLVCLCLLSGHRRK